MFYPEIKKHTSPSALDNWFNSRSAFIKSYFAGERSPDTASMKGGRIIHKLVEEGFIPAKCKYRINEDELRVAVVSKKVGEEMVEVEVFGKPDSYERDENASLASFVDYKSGKENTWDNAKLGSDIKMKVTAWLVWWKTNQPEKVYGFIEYIPTIWKEDTREIAWTGEDTEIVAEWVYTGEELREFTKVITKAIDDINEEYEKWLLSSDMFIKEEDVAEYARLEKSIKFLEEQQKPIKERIFAQMSSGSLKSYKTDDGSFSITTRKSYSYPADLKFQVGETVMTLSEGEKIADAMKACKDNYELTAIPVSTSSSLGFKAKKIK